MRFGHRIPILHTDLRVPCDAGLFIYCIEECDNGTDLSFLVLESFEKVIRLDVVSAAFPCMAAEVSIVMIPGKNVLFRLAGKV